MEFWCKGEQNKTLAAAVSPYQTSASSASLATDCVTASLFKIGDINERLPALGLNLRQNHSCLQDLNI